MNKIVVLVGKSGCGKDFFACKLKILGFNFISSYSSRPMREGEQQGNPYKFISKDEFLKLIEENKFIEYRSYNTKVDGKSDTWYYGVHKDDVNNKKHYVVVLDLLGLQDFQKLYGKRVIPFYIHCDTYVREIRAKSRGGFNQIEWDRRVKADNNDFKDFGMYCDYCIDNSDEHWYSTLGRILKHIK